MISVIPVLLLALVVWLGRELPRPQALTAAAVVVPAATFLTVPYTSFFNGSLYNDTFALIPLARLAERIGDPSEVEILVAVGMVVAAVLFASVPRRTAAWAVPLAVFLFLTISSASVYAAVKFHAAATHHAGGLRGSPSWIDDAVGRDARVEFLYTPEIMDPHIAWQAEFWNRSIRRVFGVTSQAPALPDVSAPLDPATGRIHPSLPAGSPDLKPAYAVAAGLDIAGETVATSGILGLYRLRPPLRVEATTENIAPDRWVGATAAYNRYSSLAGRRLVVVLSRAGITGPPPARVRLSIGPLRVKQGIVSIARTLDAKTLTVRNGAIRQVTLRTPPRPFRVELQVTPTFSPSQFGSADTRQLGVRVAFRTAR